MNRSSLSRPSRSLRRTATLGLLSLTVALPAGPARAVGFLPVVEELPDSDIVVRTVDGREVAGHITSYIEGPRGLTRIVVEDAAGGRHKLPVADIVRLTVPVTGLLLANDGATTIQEAVKTDWERLAETRELVWDTLTEPGRKKPALYQRLNPGFDTRIQVYGMRNKETAVLRMGSLGLTGGLPKAYLVVREGGEPMLVRKSDYAASFATLFGDCPDVAASFPEDERGFRRFADHVYFFETSCR